MYGLFTVGRAYRGVVESASSPINWEKYRVFCRRPTWLDADSREDGSTWRSPATGSVVAADFKVSSEGMQRITYQDLIDAGLDLTGVDPSQIAVGRWMVDPCPVISIGMTMVGLSPVNVRKSNISRGGSFGTNHVIDFCGVRCLHCRMRFICPSITIVSALTPQKSAEQSANSRAARLMQEAAYHRVPVIHDDTNQYSMTSVLDDPWYVKKMRANHATSSYTATIHVDSAMREDKVSHLEVVVAGDTDFPESPDHHVEVYVNGQFIDSIMFDGRVS